MRCACVPEVAVLANIHQSSNDATNPKIMLGVAARGHGKRRPPKRRGLFGGAIYVTGFTAVPKF